jgi:hypothetical protein
MQLIDFMEKAIQIEGMVAECYSALSKQCEPEYAARLRRLSDDEINHRNILNMGKTFVIRAPDLFGRVNLPEKDLDEGSRALAPLLESILSEKDDWWESLEKLKKLESILERVHITSSVIIQDPSLRALFKGLSAGDQNHEFVLLGILSEAPCHSSPAQKGRASDAA